ncbi:MAG: Nre family DNA repair protein [Candidatus Methanodesulfokora washburnensis]|jgi:hypothetical protein
MRGQLRDLPRSECVICKGYKRLCGLDRCPIISDIMERFGTKAEKSFLGATPPFVLVGEYNYPNVRVGPAVAGDPELAVKAEDHRFLLERNLLEIARIRTSHIIAKLGRERDLEEIRLSSMSERPVQLEVEIEKLRRKSFFDSIVPPVGPVADAKSVKLSEEPKVPSKIEKVVYDTDLRAVDAVKELYLSGIDVYHSTRLLSLGMLGTRERRRLVPTRWSITAVDSMLGDFLKRKVLELPEYSEDILLYKYEFNDNRYMVLLLPGVYQLKIAEVWLPRGLWTSDKEEVITNYENPVRGFELMDGGHYAMRLPVLEHLIRMRRQATCIAIREIGPGYFIPVGNWQIRESLRKAFLSEPERYDSLREALSSILSGLRSRIRIEIPRGIGRLDEFL